jgi:hypothetical protein
MVAPVHNFDPKTLSCDGRGGWQGTLYYIASALWSSGKKIALDVGGPSSIDFIFFVGQLRSSEAAMGVEGRGGGAAPRLG